MSYSSQMQAMAHSEQQVQQQLQSLVQHLRWSYVALWTFNPQTRNLGWKGGHWRRSGTEIWSEEYFKSTYKSCQFRTSFRSVGMAHAEGRNIWLNESDIRGNAGSKEQAEFLQRARISTAMFIPWSDGVLELGTSDNLPKDQHLMEKIQIHFMPHIVPTLEQQQLHNSQLSAPPMQAGHVVSQAPASFSLESPQLPARSMMQGPASYNSPLRHLSDNSITESFEPNSLNQQLIRRTASMSSMNPDMFLQQPEDLEQGPKEVGNNCNEVNALDTDNMLLQRAWSRLPTVTTTTRAATQQQITPTIISHTVAAPNQLEVYNYPPVQQRTRGQYRSRSGTTSSSVSSLDEAGTRLSVVDSPEQTNNMFLMAGSQRQTSHSNTSSSSRRGASSHSPEMNQLDNTMTNTETPSLQEENNVEDDSSIQLDAINLMLAAEEPEPLDSQEQTWRCDISGNDWPSLENTSNNISQMNLVVDSNVVTNGNSLYNSNNNNNGPTSCDEDQQSTQKPFKSWRHAARVLAQRSNDRSQNQELLRRCIDMMKQIPHSNVGIQNSEAQAVMHNVGQHGPRVASSSSPETVTEMGMAHDPFDQGPQRMQRRPRGGSRIASMGPVHSGHDEAAMNHMMAERRRRVKQKENFAALRRLVPIISKADKASILGDAIVYLKDLQRQVEGLEASKVEGERRYENLEKLHKDLEQRNKELESMVRSNARLHRSM